MRSVLPVAVLASLVLVAGCGSSRQRARPDVKSLSPTKSELEWLARVGLTVYSPAASSPAAVRKARAIRRASSLPAVELVRLKVYAARAPAKAQPASLVLAVSQPAYFLRHQLTPILRRLGAPVYLRVVDERKKKVLEWYQAAPRGRFPGGGMLDVPVRLRGCSPIVALGWPSLEPCPAS